MPCGCPRADKPTLVLGPLEPVIAEGMLPTFRGHFNVVHQSGNVTATIKEAVRLGAAAVLLNRDVVAAQAPFSSPMLVIGMSSRCVDALVARGPQLYSMSNPTPADVSTLILNAQRGR